MTPKRFYFLMIAMNFLIIILIFGCIYFANKFIAEKTDRLVSAKTSSKVAEEKQTALIRAKKDIEKYRDLNEVAKSIVPQDKDQAKTVREINKLALESGIELKDIKFLNSTLGQKAVAATGTDGSKATPIPLSQVKPVDGISGVYTLEITITSSDTKPVPYDAFKGFLQKLEQNRRTAHVSSIRIQPNEKLGGVSFGLTLNAYVKP